MLHLGPVLLKRREDKGNTFLHIVKNIGVKLRLVEPEDCNIET